jgi:uncharacterized protein involved in outer membrane biogenesis
MDDTAKRPWWKRLLKVLGAVVGVLVLAVVAAPLWTPMLSGVVAAQIESATGKPTRLDSVRLSVIGGSVQLAGLRVGEAAEGQPADLLDVESARAGFSPLALLTGGFTLRDVSLEGGTLTLRRDAEGRWSFGPLLEGGDDTPEPQPEGGEPFSLSFMKPGSAVKLTDVRVVYEDEVSGNRGPLEGLAVTITAAGPHDVRFEGGVSLPDLVLGGLEAAKGLGAARGRRRAATAGGPGRPPGAPLRERPAHVR